MAINDLSIPRGFHRLLLAGFLALLFFAPGARGQTTAFTFQGRLNDSGVPANGSYDIELKLFGTATVGTGTQIGATIDLSGVPVTSGVFTVQPDFTAAAFPGADRFVEVAVKPAGSANPFTILTPRQPITPTPYALHSASALTADSATNFNISGNGTAVGTLSGNVVNAATQFNIGGNRVLSIGGEGNTFAGVSAGTTNTTGGFNAFFGMATGKGNTTGGYNAFFGGFAGADNTMGEFNVFVGFQAGAFNTTGLNNTFVGGDAAITSTGNDDTALGAVTVVSPGVSDSTAIGIRSEVDRNNSLVLGAIKGVNGAGVTTFVGIGTTTPSNLLDVNVGSSADADPGITIQGQTSSFGDIGLRLKNTNAGNEWYIDSTGTGSGYGAGKLAFTLRGSVNPAMTLLSSGNVGVGTTAPQAKLDVRGDVKLGSTGQYFAPGGEEDLRIIRGVVSVDTSTNPPTPVIAAGSGFTVSTAGVGVFYVTFNTAFKDVPSVTATADRNGFADDLIAQIDRQCGCDRTKQVRITITHYPNTFESVPFCFIAAGTR